MNNILSKIFFAACAVLLVMDIAEYWRVQHEFPDGRVVPLLLLGILGHFAFERKASAA